MKFSNAEGGLDLAVAGYQLGEGEHGDGFNCLNVDGTVRHPRGAWRFRAKFCRRDHLLALADWFDAVAAGQVPVVASVGGFTGHELAFAVAGSGLRPEWGHDPVMPPAAPGVLRVTFGESTGPPGSTIGE